MRRLSRPVAAAIGIAVLTFLVYGSTLSNALVWDDRELIGHHPGLRNAWDLAELFGSPYWGADDYLYRPLTSWTLALNYRAHVVLGFPGEHPVGYHFVNLLLHFGVGWLVYLFSRALRLFYWPALVVALLFTVHPIHSEAVAAIVGRAELLSALFGLSFLLLHHRRFPLPVGSLLFLLALWSKESAVAFLPLALWMDLCFRGRERLRWGAYITYGLTLAGWLALRFFAVGGNPRGIPFLDNPLVEASTVERLMTAAWVQLEYLRLQLFPVGLSSDYSYNQIPVVSNLMNPRAVVFVLLVLGAFWIAWRTRKQHPLVPFATIGYAILFALTSNFLFPIGTIMGERLAYSPSILFCVLLGYGTSHLERIKGRGPAAAVGLLLLLFAGLTVSRNRIWLDPEGFARAQVRTAPESARAYYTLGLELHAKKQLDESVEALDRALSILPAYPEAWDRLGMVRADLGDPGGAVDAYRRATEVFPGYTEAWIRLARAHAVLGDANSAIDAMLRAIALDSRSERSYQLLGIFRQEVGDLEGAIQAYEQAIRIQPQFARAHSNLGVVYATQGRLQEAEAAWRRALELDPDDGPARNNLEQLSRVAGED